MKDEINKICLKTPNLKKMFLRFEEQGDELNVFLIKEIYNVINKNKNRLSNLGINYLQIKNLNSLIDVLNSTLNIKVVNNKNTTKGLLIHNLEKDNIQYDIHKDEVQFEIDSFEKMKEYGSDAWCIKKSLSLFNRYKGKDKNSIFLIIAKFDKEDYLKDNICLTISDNKELMFANDSNDIDISYHSFFIKKLNKKVKKTKYLSENDGASELEKDKILFASFLTNNFILFGFYHVLINPIFNDFFGFAVLSVSCFAGFLISLIFLAVTFRTFDIPEFKHDVFIIFQLCILFNFIGTIIFFYLNPSSIPI